VNAVWNGKEALDYLLEKDTPDHPQPDIILMDVQMPIMDGYRATHTIRHRQPYANKARLRGIPIVAMTASAIQGDREKCKRAGMDDYLAKPVQGKILEKMLVKWALEIRKDRRHVEYHQDTTNSSMTDEGHSPIEEPTPPPTMHQAPATQDAKAKSYFRDQAETRHERVDYSGESAFARSSETENASVVRRVAAEEQAIYLRDEKLLGMASHPRRPTFASENSHHAAPAGPSHALTRENMGKFEHEQEEQDDAAVEEAGSRHHHHHHHHHQDMTAESLMNSSLHPEGATSVLDVDRTVPPSEAGTGVKPSLVSRPTIISVGAAPTKQKKESEETVARVAS